MNKNSLITLLIVLFGVSFVINCIQFRSAKNQENYRLQENLKFQAALELNRAEAKRAGDRSDSLQVSFENRHVSDSLALSDISVRNKAMSETVQKLRIPVQPMIDTVEALGNFVEAYDSLLAGKNEEIEELKLRHSAQVVELKEIIVERVNEIMAQAAIAETWRQTAINTDQDLQKETKRKKVWRTIGLFGIGTTGILLLLAK